MCLLYEPLYVGKGKDSRLLDHVKYSNRHYNEHFKNKLRKIQATDLDILDYTLIIADGLTEEQAFELESKLIETFGRFDLRSGSLVNHTEGGEGVKGYLYTEEQRKEKSKRTAGRNNPMYGKRHTNIG